MHPSRTGAGERKTGGLTSAVRRLGCDYGVKSHTFHIHAVDELDWNAFAQDRFLRRADFSPLDEPDSDWNGYSHAFGNQASSEVVAGAERSDQPQGTSAPLRDGFPAVGSTNIGPYSVLVFSQDRP